MICAVLCADVRRQRRLVQRQTHLPRRRCRATLRQVPPGHVAPTSQHARRNRRLSRSFGHSVIIQSVALVTLPASNPGEPNTPSRQWGQIERI